MTGRATVKLLDALQNHGATIKSAPHGWVATCPVPSHEDRNPSFSVQEGNGMVLYRCRSGCDQAVVTDALYTTLGLRPEDLYDNGRGVEYNYRDRPGGREVRKVRRFTDRKSGGKTFTQTGPQARAARGAALYRPNDFDVDAAVKAGQEVFVCEGEGDADILYRHGVAAVSAAAGAGNWDKHDYSGIARAARVTIVVDDDDAGYKRGYGLYRHLVDAYDANVRIVVPMAGNDAKDHLLQGLAVTDFKEIPGDPDFEEQVAEVRRSWRITREAKNRDGAAFAAAAIENFQPKTLRDIQAATEQARDWIIPDLLERHERYVLTGEEGAGKTHYLRQIMICAAAGLNPFYSHLEYTPVTVLAIDAENTELQWQRNTKYITSLVEAKGGRSPLDNVIVQAGYRMDFTQQAHIDYIHGLIDAHKPDIVFLGPLYKLMPKEVTNDTDAAPLLAALDGIRERGVALLMEAHAGKAKGEDRERNLAPRGSSALLGWPEFGYGLRAMKNDTQLAALVPWRGDREQRPWPKMIRRGQPGEYPWMPANAGEM